MSASRINTLSVKVGNFKHYCIHAVAIAVRLIVCMTFVYAASRKDLLFGFTFQMSHQLLPELYTHTGGGNLWAMSGIVYWKYVEGYGTFMIASFFMKQLVRPRCMSSRLTAIAYRQINAHQGDDHYQK